MATLFDFRFKICLVNDAGFIFSRLHTNITYNTSNKVRIIMLSHSMEVVTNIETAYSASAEKKYMSSDGTS